MPVHICPVCGQAHEVHPVHDRLSYGYPLPCSPRCRRLFGREVRPRPREEQEMRHRPQHEED